MNTETKTELSYVDLLNKLAEDIGTDTSMPKPVKTKALNQIQTLFDELFSYSY